MELTQRQAKKYQKAAKKEKGRILDEYCGLTGVSRNLAGKRFRKVIRDVHPRVLKDESPKKKRGRKPTYTGINKAIVRRAWELSDEICGERLHPVIGDYLNQLEENRELKYYGKRYIIETRKISERTLKRIIAKFPKAGKKKRSKGNSSLYNKEEFNPNVDNIPWETGAWSQDKYDKTLVGENNPGVMGPYHPVVHYLSKEEFESLGCPIDSNKVPEWK